MAKPKKPEEPTSIDADKHQWSRQSQQSVAFDFDFIREYTDRPYECRRCGAACVFTAPDQKYTFEVKKASIDQRRKFCAACWSASHQLKRELLEHEARWVADRSGLAQDRAFLQAWHDLLVRWKEFEPYKSNVARIDMLRKLLGLDGGLDSGSASGTIPSAVR